MVIEKWMCENVSVQGGMSVLFTVSTTDLLQGVLPSVQQATTSFLKPSVQIRFFKTPVGEKIIKQDMSSVYHKLKLEIQEVDLNIIWYAHGSQLGLE